MTECLAAELTLTHGTFLLKGVLRNESDRVLRVRPVYWDVDLIVAFAGGKARRAVPSQHSFAIGPISSIPLKPNETIEFECDLESSFVYADAGAYEVRLDYDTLNRNCYYCEGDQRDDLRVVSKKVAIEVPERMAPKTPYSDMSWEEYLAMVAATPTPGPVKRFCRVVWSMLRDWWHLGRR